MSGIYNAIEAAKRQWQYCEEQECPVFIPANGWCPQCGKNIFEPYTFHDHDTVYGITVEEAGTRLITSCPHCDYSFVE